MLKFNNNNIITGEIKQLLKDFNLPKCKVWAPGITIFKDLFYINAGNLCIGAEATDGSIYLKLVQPYIHGQSTTNLTKNLIISNMIYDSYTHRYLGDYLRFYRDTKNINLMSMYNCFSDELAKNLKINVKDASGNTRFDFDTTNDNFKIYMVPIKFFQKYTIGIECDTKIEIIAGVYSNDKMVGYSGDANDITLYSNTYVRKCGTKISSPFVYDKVFNLDSLVLTKRLYQQEDNLKLFIKVPASSTSSIVVLEGDFAKFAELHFDDDDTFSSRKINFEVCNFESTAGANTERNYISRPQLLDFNSTISYPFADRLIEYLFGNVITSDDEIAKNVTRVQKRLVQRFNEYMVDQNGNYIYLLDLNGDYVLSNGTSISKFNFDLLPLTDPIRKMRVLVHKYVGMSNIINQATMWSTHLRNVCYDAIVSSDIQSKAGANKFDLIGFIDKDSEQAIGEYVEVK